jgi:hypothetical protein
MRILALDLGSTSRKTTKTYATLLDTDSGAIERTNVATSADALLSLIGTWRPERVVVEITRGCGWVVDLCRGAGVQEVQVANPMESGLAQPDQQDRSQRCRSVGPSLGDRAVAHCSPSGAGGAVLARSDRVPSSPGS